MVLLGCFVAQTRGVMLLREGWPSWTGVYTLFRVETRVASIINTLGTRLGNAVKKVYFAYYAIIT